MPFFGSTKGKWRSRRRRSESLTASRRFIPFLRLECRFSGGLVWVVVLFRCLQNVDAYGVDDGMYFVTFSCDSRLENGRSFYAYVCIWHRYLQFCRSSCEIVEVPISTKFAFWSLAVAQSACFARSNKETPLPFFLWISSQKSGSDFSLINRWFFSRKIPNMPLQCSPFTFI